MCSDVVIAGTLYVMMDGELCTMYMLSSSASVLRAMRYTHISMSGCHIHLYDDVSLHYACGVVYILQMVC